MLSFIIEKGLVIVEFASAGLSAECHILRSALVAIIDLYRFLKRLGDHVKVKRIILYAAPLRPIID